MHDARMEHRRGKVGGEEADARIAAPQHAMGDHVVGVDTAALLDLLGEVAEREDRALHARADDEGAAPLDAHQQPLRLQFAQGALHGEARGVELAREDIVGR